MTVQELHEETSDLIAQGKGEIPVALSNGRPGLASTITVLGREEYPVTASSLNDKEEAAFIL